MRAILASILAVSLTALAYAGTPPDQSQQCLPKNSPQTIRVTDAEGQTVQNVLCCCATYNGGQCCKYVSFCTGSYVPGCVCN
jgi:hypothetical protein